MNDLSIHEEMNQDLDDKVLAAILGLFGGMVAFLKVVFLDGNYWISLSKAGGTAFVCALMGLAAKQLYTSIQKHFKNRKFRKHKK